MLTRRSFLKALFATTAAVVVLANPIAPKLVADLEAAAKQCRVNAWLDGFADAWNNPPPSLEWTPEGARKRLFGLDKPLKWDVS